MNKSNVPLSKICSNCGLQKPLSAFMQISGANGTVYGNLCSACRKIGIKDKAPKKDSSDTESETGLNLDSKAKVHGEIDKRQHKKSIEEDYYHEREEDEILETKKIIHKIDVKEKEKYHREGYLRKRSFLDPDLSHKTKPTKVFGGAEHALEEAEIETRGPMIDTQISGKIKNTQNVALKTFLSWVGKDAALSRALQQNPQKPNFKPGDAKKEETQTNLTEAIEEKITIKKNR